jgi:hypothetical protein
MTQAKQRVEVISFGNDAMGHQRRFERASATSGLHPTPEVSLHCGEPTFRATSGHYRNAPIFDYLAAASPIAIIKPQ